MELVTSIAGNVGGELAKYTLVPLGRQIGYLMFYNGNINDLAKELKRLSDKKSAVDLIVADAERKLCIPAPEVKTWQQNADAINGQAMKFLEEEIKRNRKCLNGLCPNVMLRHSLSRKAEKMTQEICVLVEEGKNYSENVLPAPPRPLGTTFNTEDIMEFESRNLIMNKVLKAISDDSSSMISICGQGGVGKTKMVERIVQMAEGQKLVDETALAVVTRNPDVKKILGDIASCLGIDDYQDKNEQEIAHKLHERIIEKSDKKILLVLDDVWTEIDFQRLRIPPAGKRAGYKILLTSRREDECHKMGSLSFRVDALTIEEGWDLFKATAFGENFIDNQDNLSQLAKKIADECDGLPIAIATIAKALKGRDIRIWADTLNQLQSSNLEGISGMDKVHFSLKLSYNLLQREEAKACFLLCCIFPEDYVILVEDLMRCAVGLRLLQNTETILQARNRVCALVGELKESFLLLDGKKQDSEYVKMHDVVRDVAISIASRDKSYLVCCNNMMRRWPIKWQDRYNDCTAISVFSEEIKEHVTDVECPKLQLLQLQSRGSLPDNFLEGMKELKVVYFNGCFPPKSLTVLKNVRTLHLSHVTKTSTFEDLQNLEILKIGRWQELPNGVGLMKNVRLLDLRDATSLKYIPAGVLSKLSKLEELYVSLEFVRWESTVDGEKMNASLMELKSDITTLEFCVSDISHLPKKHILENLVSFKISLITRKWDIKENQKTGNALILSGDSSEIVRSGICVLLKRAECLELENVENLKNGINELGHDGFPELKTLEMRECYEIEQLVDMKKIKVGCFNMLRKINITCCVKLDYLFPAIMARRFSQSLQSIKIYWCKKMEAVFKGEEEDNNIEFPNLKEIYLSDLPNLKALWIHKSKDHPKVKSNIMEQPNCILFPSSWIVTSNLKVLTLISCHSLKMVFSTSVAEKLLHLQSLVIQDCEQVEYIVGQEEGNTHEALLFPMLTMISLRDLPKLVSFCIHNHVCLDWSSLVDVDIFNCPEIQSIIGTTQSPSALDKKQILFKIPPDFSDSLKVATLRVSQCANLMHLFTSRVAKLLVNLEKVEITENCNMEQVIVKEDGEEEATGITVTLEFSQLVSITLEDLDNMRCFYGGTYAMGFPLLEFLKFKRCSSMKIFSYASSLCTPKLQSIEIDDREIDPAVDLNMVVRKEILAKINLCKVRDMARISLTHLSNEEISEIRQIKIKKCHDLLRVIPCNLMAKLQNVEMIDVKKCDLVEEILEYDGADIENANAAICSRLQHVYLDNLNNLKHAFNKIPATVIVFQRLKMLKIERCERLKSIFSVSMVKSLLELEQLKIFWCHDLEAIIEKEDEEEKAVAGKIVVPLLWSVDVSHTKKLKCFYSGSFALELPSLRSLKLKCDSMESFSNGTLSTPQLTQVQINENDYPHSGDINEDIKTEKFGKIDIECIEDFMKMCHATEDLIRIKYLHISDCYTLPNAIPYNLTRNVQKLEKLIVDRCASLEEVFEFDGVNIEETSVAVISNLEEISLTSLYQLKHIFNKGLRSIVRFQKLKKMHVCGCGDLKNIFFISLVRDLVQLEEVKITNCHGVEQIVANEEQTEEEEEITKKIVFSQLKRIEISYSSQCLFRLKCFYGGMYALEFPLLESLSLDKCYSMTTFSTGSSLSTPMLQQVRINDSNYPCTGDLNQALKEKMLDKVYIHEDEQLMRICRIAEEGTRGIQDLRISCSDKLFNAIPRSVILNLERLQVRLCHSVEAIFEFDEKTSFSSLERIKLDDLTNLKHIFNKFPKGFIGFQQLTSLEIQYCNSLKSVFPVPVVMGLPQLKELAICDCGEMEQIIAGEDKLGEEELVTEKIVLPQLKSIEIFRSPDLKCFYNGICDIELPLLESLSLDGCFDMKTFSSGSVTTPNLQNLQIDSEEDLYSGNLNADLLKKWHSVWDDAN